MFLNCTILENKSETEFKMNKQKKKKLLLLFNYEK